METLLQIGPWITLGVAAGVVLFFCRFYMVRLYQVYRKQNSSLKASKKSFNQADSRQKIKAEILSDLEKKLEAL